MLRNIITYTSTFFAIFTFSATSAFSGGDEWKAKMIADAITAAPPAVTEDATIYAWDSNRQMILLRSGAGSYVCLASGFMSTRIGKTPLPYPDPMCLDQNAWKFMRHFLSQKNPMKPSEPYPTEPGLCWMLAGMAVAGGMLDIGSGTKFEVTVAKSGAKIVRMTPHLMILPFPINEKTSGMSTKYDTDHPKASWVMAAKSPIEHLMVHFSKQEVNAMMNSN